MKHYQQTPDGRYFIVRGRLWRCTNPALEERVRKDEVAALMAARRSVKSALADHDEPALRTARSEVDRAKRALGERGPVWWDDGAPDETGKLAKNSRYADWWQAHAESR